MKKVLSAAILAIFLFSSMASAEKILQVDPQKYIDQPSFVGFVPDRFVVVLKDGINVDQGTKDSKGLSLSELNGFADLAARFGVTKLRPQFIGSDRSKVAGAKELSKYYKVTISEGTLKEAMAAYEALPSVDHVEPIGVHTLYATPNDTYYDNPPPTFPYDQWHYWDTYGIEADQAWDSETGSQTVLVGDLDIGLKWDHGDIGGSNPPGPADASTNGNVWVNTNEIPGNGQDDDGNGYTDDVIGWDFVDRTDWYSYPCIDLDCGGADNDPWDGDGHGTHTAGTIAAITNNGYAVAGVAGGFGDGTFAGGGNGVKVVPCRIGYDLDYFIYGRTGVVIMDYVAEAMYYMANLKIAGWDVAAVNCSFGTSNSGGLSAAASYLIAQDVIIVVAAGNANSSSPDYLGSRGDCLDVGATDANGNPASFSNYGSWVDIAAPGVEVLSTITDPSDPTSDYVAVLDGTSMACPHVVGVAALLESYNPALSAADKIAIITDPANVKAYNMTKNVGVGIVDARKCLDAAGPNTDPPVANFSGDPTSGTYPLTVDFTDLSSNNPTSWSWDFGDGVGTSNQQNPSYTYTSAGTYTVSLTATNDYGSDTDTKVNYITVTAPPPPVADFSGSPTSGEYPLQVDFTDLSTNNPTSWSWDFGDGVGTSMAQNPSYTYSEAGTYTVSLTATNAYGSDTETKVDYITVTEPAMATQAFALSDIYVAGTVSGDYTYTHASDDAYEVITEVASTSHPKKTTSYCEHKWDFSVGGGTTVTFYLEAYRPNNPDGDDFVFEYSLDDVNYSSLVTVASSTEQVYSASLPANTSGTVYIRVTDSNRSWGNSSNDAVYIDQMYIEYESTPGPPVADFSGTPSSGYYPLDVTFTDLSSGNPTSWSWDFGDGVGTSNAQNPSYTYTAAGTYTVSLSVSNAYGSDATTKVDYITVTEPGSNYSHVANMVVGTTRSGPNTLGTCTVTIEDQGNSPLSNATVYVSYDGPTSGSLSGVTGADGTVYFETTGFKKPSGEWCFEVTDVTHATYTYDPGSNAVTRSCESGWVYGNGRIASTTVPGDYRLHQNTPNPFNPVTDISFSLPYDGYVKLEIFNIMGQKVTTLVNRYLSAGEHVFTWNAAGEASGIYFYRLSTDQFNKTMKMVLMK